jgi:hypothetical protein
MKPNLFIVGAAKCGTTSLHDYLNQHPEVHMSEHKEIKYFGQDIASMEPKGNQNLTVSEYVSYFSPGKCHKVVGESSPQYLYSLNAAKEIFEFNPKSKIIIMLRNPMDTLISLHKQLLHVGLENEHDLWLALKKEEKDILKEGYPGVVLKAPKKTYYLNRLNYAPQVQRYYDTFGKENVKVVFFDDFISDTIKTYQDICFFLRVDEKFIPDIPVKNPSKIIKYKILHKMYFNRPGLINLVWKLLPVSVSLKIKEKLINFNTRIGKSDLLTRNELKVLKEHFNSEINSLEFVINKDLEHWK